MGLEPCTNYIGGKSHERQNDTIKVLEPMDSLKHQLIIEFYDNEKDME